MMSDDLVATLEALGEDDFYYFPATTKAVIDRAVAEIDRLRPRIAELEAALHDMAKHVWRGDWDKLKPETRAALGEKE